MKARSQEIKYWYENLNTESLENIHQFYTHDTFFKDPFHEFKSIEKLKKIFTKSFKHLKNPRFIVHDILIDSEDPKKIFMNWDFNFKALGKSFSIHGSTLFKLNSDGLIYYHRDYWDSSSELFVKLPILGPIFKLFVSLF